MENTSRSRLQKAVLNSKMMSPLPLKERKACIACAISKRTCNKQMPRCQRCTTKNLNCQYPTTRRYRRTQPASSRKDQASAADAVIPHADHPQPESPAANLSRDAPISCKLWFLEWDTWLVDNAGASTCRFDPAPIHASLNLKGWTSGLTDWLRQLVEEGCNPFIHKQLYLETGLPQCLQDAWTTATAYFSKTTLNEHIVMRIVEDRANSLLRAHSHEDDSFMAVIGLDTIEHLARVQALFIYQHLRLYDGSIRQRALAESTIPTLLTWCAQLWQSATLDAGYKTQLLSSPELGGLDSSDELGATPYWKAWILSESVRRTWLVCHSESAAYFRERDGWNEGIGEIWFTASQGLWDSASSEAWAQLVTEKEPLFVKSFHADELLSIALPTEVDNFSTTFMALLVGKEKVDGWAASKPRIEDPALQTI